MGQPPRLTIGLPVYNGENYLREAIESLLGQSFEDFELIISDNASTDGTAAICEEYQRRDLRVQYIRQPRNIGLAANHNFTLEKARGEFFKWVGHDDLIGRDFLKLCIEALDAHPDVVLASAWTARIDFRGQVVKAEEYPLATASPSAPERFRSVLFDSGGDDDNGVVRTSVARSIAPKGSYYRADRTTMGELVLHGRFYHVPQWLFFRRDHADRAEWKFRDVRSWCANLDPRRANRFRYPVPRLYLEYIWAYVQGIRTAPLTTAGRLACYRHLAEWVLDRVRHGRGRNDVPAAVGVEIDLDSIIPGRQS